MAARRASILGFEGKWCIHPSQVELANGVFSPDDRLVSRTRRIMEAMEKAADDGRGAVSLDGRLIDAASLRMAEHLLTKIELIEERENGHARSSKRWRPAPDSGPWHPSRMARPVVLGVVGDSAAGKTTLTRGVVRILGGGEGVSYISGDDYHRYERQQRAELGITPLDPAANYLDILGQHLGHLRTGQPVSSPSTTTAPAPWGRRSTCARTPMWSWRGC